MIRHIDLVDTPFARSRQLKLLINNREVRFGGNAKLKIYGKLNCRSGRRMKAETRVFFASEAEAIENGYRPCGHCMREAYEEWKKREFVILSAAKNYEVKNLLIGMHNLFIDPSLRSG